MVSKVQTFEGWATSEGYIPKHMAADVYEAIAKCWQAAHENAAMVCEGMMDSDSASNGGYSAGRDCWIADCADAIREANK